MKYLFAILLLFLLTSLRAQSSSIVELRISMNGEKVVVDKAYYSPRLADSLTMTKVMLYLTSPVAEEPMLIDASTNESKHLSVAYENQQLLFQLGIDSLINVSGVQGGDLDPMHGMYWTWNSGYINVKIEGHSSAIGTRKNQFKLHLGGYMAPYESCQVIALPFKQEAGSIIIELALDVFFSGIDLAESPTVMSPSMQSVELSELLAKCFKVAE